jgi:hypothetical protein
MVNMKTKTKDLAEQMERFIDAERDLSDAVRALKTSIDTLLLVAWYKPYTIVRSKHDDKD